MERFFGQRFVIKNKAIIEHVITQPVLAAVLRAAKPTGVLGLHVLLPVLGFELGGVCVRHLGELVCISESTVSRERPKKGSTLIPERNLFS